jgi:two-component system sensor kinase FixL
MRIALVLNGQAFSCQGVTLPFSVEGYPSVDLVWYGSQPRAPAPVPVNQLPELDPARFDLILDGQFLTAGLPELSPDKLNNLITGPVAGFLDDLVCHLQEVRHRQEINTGIIMSATDALVTIDEDHLIVGYNLGAEQMFGYSREEAVGQDLKLIVPPPFKEVHGDYLRRYLATRVPHVLGRQRRLTALRRSGEEFTLSISFSVAEIHGSLYFTAIMRDVTEYKAMEDRLLQSERLAAVGNTVTRIAHEIKNPLLIIGGFARQLVKVPELDDRARRKLTIMAEEVSHLEEMVAEMRDFVHPPPAQKRPDQVATAVKAALELFADFFREHHIKVRMVDEGPLPAVSFDPRQLRQVFLNLFKNALEAMPQGGELVIASRARESQLEITVSDTGEGMPPEVAASIFQPYFTTKEKGTGLGLAICRSIIEEHGGRIFADSAPGAGTTFTIRLPLIATPPEAAAPPPEAS